LGKGAAEHFQNVLREMQGIKQTGEVGLGRTNRGGEPCCGQQMAGLGASQMELALYVQEGDLEIAHGHLGSQVSEQLHHGG
jgi:hypothetical protein